MDWALSIRRNRDALLAVAVAILALIGLRHGHRRPIPRHLLLGAALALVSAAAVVGPRADLPALASRLVARLQALADAPEAPTGRAGPVRRAMDPLPAPVLGLSERRAPFPDTS
jgi:hypothetical protein